MKYKELIEKRRKGEVLEWVDTESELYKGKILKFSYKGEKYHAYISIIACNRFDIGKVAEPYTLYKTHDIENGRDLSCFEEIEPKVKIEKKEIFYSLEEMTEEIQGWYNKIINYWIQEEFKKGF